jgi:hypothetical protein
MYKLAAVLALAAITGWGGSKERDWQTAKLLDPDRTKYFSDEHLEAAAERPGLNTSVTSAAGYQANTNSGSAPVAVHDYFIVETQGVVYLAERIRLKSSPAPNLAVTRPIKFALDKKNLYLMNENGDEYQTKIVKQVERERER